MFNACVCCPFLKTVILLSANIIKTNNKEVRLQKNSPDKKKNQHRIGEMFSNCSAYELIIFKGQVIFIRVAETRT